LGRRYDLRTMDTALPEGSLFADRYRIDHLIGEGPRKQTYRAWDPKARRQVALAVMLPGSDPRATHREVGSPYLTGVPLARFPVPDGLGGPDRYGALATSRDRRRERR